MSFTPDPPRSSAASSESVTSWLFQPAALAAGNGTTVVVGAVTSVGRTKNSRLFEAMSNCWRPPVPSAPMLRSSFPLNSMLQSLMTSSAVYVRIDILAVTAYRPARLRSKWVRASSNVNCKAKSGGTTSTARTWIPAPGSTTEPR